MDKRFNFIFWLARHMRLNPNANGANATGSVIAVAGVALALAIMECTIAVVEGFQGQITERIIGFDGQISVLPSYDPTTATSEESVQLTPLLREALTTLNSATEPTIKLIQPGILKTDNDFAGMYFVGYDTAHDYQFERQFIAEGQLPDFHNPESSTEIAISSTAAKSMGLSVGDKVFAYFIIDEAIKSRRFLIKGIYDTGFSDYDKTIIFAPLSTLQTIANVDSISGTQVQLFSTSLENIERDAADLQNFLITLYHTEQIDKLYPVDNVKHTGAIFFNWLQLLDTNVVVIFILMACVAGFTLISSMFILILDRIPTIGLLRSLGATRQQVRLVFTTLAMKIVGLGMLIGNIIGIGLLLIQQSTDFLKLNPEMYYLPAVPVHIAWGEMIVLNCCVAAISIGVLLIPAGFAGRISPASTMRFE